MFRNDDISINTVIGAGTMIRGDVHSNGFIRVDGDIDGNLETPGNIIINKGARIRGNVTARSAIIGGIIQGNITAPVSIHLLTSSAVLGDIATRDLQVEDGVIINGHCIALADEQQYNTSYTNYEDKKAIQARSLMQPFFSEQD